MLCNLYGKNLYFTKMVSITLIKIYATASLIPPSPNHVTSVCRSTGARARRRSQTLPTRCTSLRSVLCTARNARALTSSTMTSRSRLSGYVTCPGHGLITFCKFNGMYNCKSSTNLVALWRRITPLPHKRLQIHLCVEMQRINGFTPFMRWKSTHKGKIAYMRHNCAFLPQ